MGADGEESESLLSGARMSVEMRGGGGVEGEGEGGLEGKRWVGEGVELLAGCWVGGDEEGGEGGRESGWGGRRSEGGMREEEESEGS